MKAVYILVALSISLFSCSKSNDSKKEAFDNEANNFGLKYNASIDWDTAEQLTCNYQNVFLKGNKVMLFKGTVNDVIEKDSTYILKVYHDDTPISIALITLTQAQYKTIKSSYKYSDGAFVIKPNKFSYAGLSIETDVESGEDGDSYLYHIGDGAGEGVLIVKGKLVDYFVKE